MSSSLFRLHVAYEGAPYRGWQIQPDEPTVEGALTEAAAEILDCRPADIDLQGASRTDAGVHATGQVAHLHCDRSRGCWELVRGLNALTDETICVNRVEPAPDGFHARYSARGKIYTYRIWNHTFDHPFDRHRHWRLNWNLDAERMRRAAARMEGTHDFTAFRASDGRCPTTVRTMRRVEVDRRGTDWQITVEGDAFLKYMVRVMVGTLVEIAGGIHPPTLVDELFEAGDRELAGRTAPGKGLTLRRVHYPDFPWQQPPPSIGGPPVVDGEASD